MAQLCSSAIGLSSDSRAWAQAANYTWTNDEAGTLVLSHQPSVGPLATTSEPVAATALNSANPSLPTTLHGFSSLSPTQVCLSVT